MPQATVIDASTTVNEIVRQYPNTLALLVASGIDACCGGEQSLADAAAEAKVDLPALIELLEKIVRSAK